MQMVLGGLDPTTSPQQNPHVAKIRRPPILLDAWSNTPGMYKVVRFRLEDFRIVQPVVDVVRDEVEVVWLIDWELPTPKSVELVTVQEQPLYGDLHWINIYSSYLEQLAAMCRESKALQTNVSRGRNSPRNLRILRRTRHSNHHRHIHSPGLCPALPNGSQEIPENFRAV